MKKFLIPIVTILILTFLLVGCGSPAATTSAVPPGTTTTKPAATTTPPAATTLTPQYGGVLRIIESRGPTTTLGWFAEPGGSGGPYTSPNIETLLRVTFDGTILPSLAESYKIADDLKSITLNIRKGVKFHDGSAFDGAAAKWNLDQQINAKVSSVAAWTSVDLVDPYTVRINLSSYKNALINDLASVVGYMVSPTAFNTQGGKEGLRWNPVGTGPFKFVSFQRDVSVKYSRFSDYWQKGKPYLDGVEYSFITDPMTQSAAFQNKEADTIGDNVGKVMVDLAQSQKGSIIIANPSGVIGMVGDSGNADSPFANLKVRQALDYAVDRPAITAARGFGYSKPNFQFAFPGTPNYITNLQTRNFDPAKAKQLLTEAGFPNGFTATMTCDSGSADKDAMTAVQAYLDAVGIHVQFVWADNASYLKARTGGWKNGVLAGAIGLDANMNNSMSRYFIKAASNYPSMAKGAEFDALYQTSLTAKTYDPVLMQKMIQYLYDNALVTSLWTLYHANIVQPYVHDTGFMSLQAWPGWTPENAWISK